MKRWLAAVGMLWGAAACAASSDWIRYQIAVDQPSHHLAQVTMLLPATSEEDLALIMPVWRPGKYRLLPLSNGVLELRATDARGNALQVERRSHNKWLVKGTSGRPVEVQYRLYADALGDRTRHIDKTHAYLDPVSVLLMAPDLKDAPARVDLDVPHGWRSESGLQRDGAHRFLAQNYDELADSPIETGLHEKLRFQVGKVPFEMVVWGENNLDTIQAAKDLAKIAEKLKDAWGDFPFERFLVIIHATDGEKGATEHRNSTVVQRPRWSFASKKGYLDFLSTGAHELIHAWNVKSYRPEGLVPYDYLGVNNTTLLWFVEGGTSYLDEQALLWAGLVDVPTYLKRLSRAVEKYERRPGNRHMSASESSLVEWVRPDGEQAWNFASNIYQKGEMLNLWLDLQLRMDSNGAHGIMDLHRRLYQGYPASLKGYSAKDVKLLLEELGLKHVEKQWSLYVDGTTPLPLKETLAKWSVNWTYKMDSERAFHRSSQPVLGVKLYPTPSEAARVQFVDDGSPAWEAGMAGGDWLVALDGKRVTTKNYREILMALKPGQRVALAYFHNGLLYQETVRLGERPSGRLALELKSPLTDGDVHKLRQWLGDAVEIPLKSEVKP